jgi:hypothetical protein
MTEDYGLLLYKIYPLTSKTTNLVYKITAEVKEGDVYWQPIRSDVDEIILLGTLK